MRMDVSENEMKCKAMLDHLHTMLQAERDSLTAYKKLATARIDELKDEVYRLRIANTAPKVVIERWQPIATAPKNASGEFYGPTLLLWTRQYGACAGKWGWGRNQSGCWISTANGTDIDDVVFWKPLEPPSAEQPPNAGDAK